MVDLDEIRPEFGEHGRRNPFIVPDGYFEGFARSLQDRIGELDKTNGKMARRKIFRPALVYISGFCILIIAGIFIARLILVPHHPQSNSETAIANLVQYSLENVDEQTIIEALGKSDIEPVVSDISKE